MPEGSAIVCYNGPMDQGSNRLTGQAEDAPSDTRDASYRVLLSGIVGRDERALAALYDATAGRVYALAVRICGQCQAAEEVVSDVYLQVWEQAQRYDATRGKVLTWLLTICRSRALDRLRRRDRAETHPEPDSLRADSASAGSDPLDIALALERGGIMHSAIQTLNPTQQQLLALAFFKGLSHREIAVHTGMPLGSVKTLLRKAMQSLKSSLTRTSVDLEQTS